MTENEYHQAVDEAMKPLEKLAESCSPEEMARLHWDVLEEMRVLLKKHGPEKGPSTG